jgi:retron-type reverse transcriptase
MYQNTTIIIRKDRVNVNTPREIHKGVRQECPLSPILLNIYFDEVIEDWLQMIQQNILAKDLIPNTGSFAGDQVIVTRTEDELQRAAYTLNNISIKYNLKISVNKTTAMAVKGKISARTKMVINNIIEQINNFNYLGYTIAVSNNRDL